MTSALFLQRISELMDVADRMEMTETQTLAFIQTVVAQTPQAERPEPAELRQAIAEAMTQPP